MPFPLPSLRESTCILLSSSAPVPFPAHTVEDAPKFREEDQCNKAVRRAALFAHVPNCKLFLRKIGVIFIITVYLTASASSSQALKVVSKTFSEATPEFRRHHDLLQQSVLTILCVWSVSAVYQTPCLCSVGFLNRSDMGSDTAFRCQSQRVIHLYAALHMSSPQRFHCCQGDRISFGFALVHQCVRDRADEAHVDSEAEAKFLIICTVSIERRRLA